MYNFLRSLFGSPADEKRTLGNEDISERNHNEFVPNIPSDTFEAMEDDLDFKGIPRFGFHMFDDFFEIQKHINELIDGMEKKMGFFQFSFPPGLPFKGEEKFYYQEDSTGDVSSLRNSYLKSPGREKKDLDLDGRVKIENVEKFFTNKNQQSPYDSSSNNYLSSPAVYSKSVYIKTIKHADGRVETIKKIRDHTGKEETIMIQGENQSCTDFPAMSPTDVSDISIFKRFFPFLNK